MDKLQYKGQLVGYTADLISLEAKLAELDIQRDELRKQIEHTKYMIAHLSALAGEGFELDVSALGFTDACRVVLRDAYPARLTAIDVRDALGKRGFDLSSYTNPLASIHTILKRLADAGEANCKEEGFRTTYQWTRRWNRRQHHPKSSRHFGGLYHKLLEIGPTPPGPLPEPEKDGK
jgi:hypothetical protein